MDGVTDGIQVGDEDGPTDGVSVVVTVGCMDGVTDGTQVGDEDSPTDGVSVVVTVGCMDGVTDGTQVVGDEDGPTDGLSVVVVTVGVLGCIMVGAGVGIGVFFSSTRLSPQIVESVTKSASTCIPVDDLKFIMASRLSTEKVVRRRRRSTFAT